MIKIEIYAPDYRQAAELASQMNLALRQWNYAGEDPLYPGTWADCEPLFERIKSLEENHGVS